tara:strand:+ start:6366 stop:6530 length:165 start_codon:yes stop_codon:yes gene_type:complete
MIACKVFFCKNFRGVRLAETLAAEYWWSHHAGLGKTLAPTHMKVCGAGWAETAP